MSIAELPLTTAVSVIEAMVTGGFPTYCFQWDKTIWKL